MGAFSKSLLSFLISFYRIFLSGFMGGNCRFYPSCSIYAENCIREHRPTKAIHLILIRLTKCRPFGDQGVDLVPLSPISKTRKFHEQS